MGYDVERVHPPTNDMMTLQDAIELANEIHLDAVDRGGQPYFLHLVRVAAQMDTDDEKIVAFLHDALEDGNVSLGDSLPPESLVALDALTRRLNEHYSDYIGRVAKNPLAVKVKVADLEDNMNLARIPTPKQADIDRWRKYEKAYMRLRELVT